MSHLSDNLRPACTACLQIGASCEYAAQDASGFDAASLKILDQLCTIEDLVRNIQPSSLDATSSSFLAPADNSTQSQSDILPSTTTWGGGEPVTFESHASAMNLDANHLVATDKLLQWPVFDTLLSSLPRFRFVDFHGADTYTFLQDLHTQQSQQDTASQINDDGEHTGLPASLHISTERSDIERLVDQFFGRVNNKNPILNRRETSYLCERYYENGPQFNLGTCVVLLTCALGAVSADFVPSRETPDIRSPMLTLSRHESLRLGHCYFVAAEKRLGAAMSQVSTLAIQCLCLAGIYHMFTIRPMRALRMFQSAGSSLQILASTGMDNLEGEAELYSSLFWMCYKSEREILAEIPISPPALRVPGFPESYPRPPPASANAPSDPWASQEEDSWYFFLSEIALRRITNQVAEVVIRHAYRADDEQKKQPGAPDVNELVTIVAEFERHFEAFRDHLPISIQFDDVPHVATTEWKQYTRGRYYRTLELMHRPFLFTVLHEPQYQQQAAAATNTTNINELAEKSLFNALRYLQHSNVTHRHHGTWLQLRNELREACLLLAAARGGGPHLRMPDGWEDGIAKALATFEYWACEFPSCETYARVIHTLAEPTMAGMGRHAGSTGRMDHDHPS